MPRASGSGVLGILFVMIIASTVLYAGFYVSAQSIPTFQAPADLSLTFAILGFLILVIVILVGSGRGRGSFRW